jgi:hypothetical protein
MIIILIDFSFALNIFMKLHNYPEYLISIVLHFFTSKKNINKRTYYTVLFIQTKTENIRSIKLCLIMQILL